MFFKNRIAVSFKLSSSFIISEDASDADLFALLKGKMNFVHSIPSGSTVLIFLTLVGTYTSSILK